MRLSEHLTKVFAGNIAPRVVEHSSRDGSVYVAWFPTWERPAPPQLLI
jgi:hypothetical protein